MKKLLFPLTVIALTLNVLAEEKVIFSEDFEWIKPWADMGNPKAEDVVLWDNTLGTAPQLSRCEINGVSLYDEMITKGFEFLTTHSEFNANGSAVANRPAGQQIYALPGYMKFGLTNYYSGIVFPPLNVEETITDGFLSFEWCAVISSRGIWDKTELVVEVINGDSKQQFPVKLLNKPDWSPAEWCPTTVSLAGAPITSRTKIAIRNADSQWPANVDLSLDNPVNYQYRYFLDNVKLYTDKSSNVSNETMSDNSDIEYYNMQGLKIKEPKNGLFIRRQGNKTEKILLK